MKLFVGLGNIGQKYNKTRHNCGFLSIDEFSRELGNENIEINWKEDTKLKSIISKIKYGNQDLILLKPTTLMNNSGEAVKKALNYYKIEISDLVVVYDDIDLPLGTIRIREKGSAGTHNGMKSIIEHLGKDTFTRIRIGIESRGELTNKKIDLTDFVLGEFTKNEYPIIMDSLKKVAIELKKLAKN